MASSTDTPIQIIIQSYQEILIQAGKHFRVIAKDGPGALSGSHSGIQAKASDSLSQYNLALNDIEGEIIQAKSVLLRDLENLRAARAPAPVPVPAPIPTPQPVAPPAPMMELPSAAAHSRSLNAAATAPAAPSLTSSKETKPVAPFPDMGMGMSADVVDLTVGDKKPSPRIQPGSVKAAARSVPPTSVKPSPKPLHKPTPPAKKVTPVPPPQIPRLQAQAFQSSNSPTQPKTQPAPLPPKTTQPSQSAQPATTAKAVQDSAMDGMPGLQPTGPSDATAGTGNSELNFTHMEFSLVPPPSESHGAPPAPMPEFDLATFVPQGGNMNATPDHTLGNNPPQNLNGSSNVDDLFNLGDTNVNLGDANGGVDMFDLGGADVNDSTFDDMMFFGDNDASMEQFDDAYFGL
ncbi:hypothetical protein F5Y10DRAFT_233358 [Nemania abortiva]|nr:hypothetical protein F5Y10DRAFT_233358 [Nemania abortiva]